MWFIDPVLRLPYKHAFFLAFACVHRIVRDVLLERWFSAFLLWSQNVCLLPFPWEAGGMLGWLTEWHQGAKPTAPYVPMNPPGRWRIAASYKSFFFYKPSNLSIRRLEIVESEITNNWGGVLISWLSILKTLLCDFSVLNKRLRIKDGCF